MRATTLIFITILCLILGGCHNSPASEAASLAPSSGDPTTFSANRNPDIAPFTKWTTVLRRMQQYGQSFPPSANRQSLSLQAQARTVNSWVNQYSYMDDYLAWGQEDYWASPAEFFARGGGDCEDFAITKYALMRQLGVPDERLGVTIAYDLLESRPHAFLKVFDDKDVWIMDNQSPEILRPEEAHRYKELFSLNSQSWWHYI